MKMNYETERLLMKILPDTAAGQTLQFYQDNREVFEQYEADRSQNFYTLSYQKALLHCEYNLAIKQSAARFWVYEKTCPERIIGTVSLQDIRRGFYQSCGLGYKFDQRVWRRGYAKESIAQCIWIAFREMNLHRIEAQTLPENEVSVPVAELPGVDRGIFLAAEFREAEQGRHHTFRVLEHAGDADKPFLDAELLRHAQDEIAVIEEAMEKEAVVAKIPELFGKLP